MVRCVQRCESSWATKNTPTSVSMFLKTIRATSRIGDADKFGAVFAMIEKELIERGMLDPSQYGVLVRWVDDDGRRIGVTEEKTPMYVTYANGWKDRCEALNVHYAYLDFLRGEGLSYGVDIFDRTTTTEGSQ